MITVRVDDQRPGRDPSAYYLGIPNGYRVAEFLQSIASASEGTVVINDADVSRTILSLDEVLEDGDELSVMVQ